MRRSFVLLVPSENFSPVCPRAFFRFLPFISPAQSVESDAFRTVRIHLRHQFSAGNSGETKLRPDYRHSDASTRRNMKIDAGLSVL